MNESLWSRWSLRSLSCALSLSLTSLFGCYTPRGAYVPVEDFSATAGTEYRIAAGDLLHVHVFQQEAVSSRARVRTDGMLSLALVKDIQAAGKTPTGLAAEIQVRLKEYINNPVVTVSLEESRPLTVSVLGEVVRPGVVTLEPGSGVLQALASAGGLTDFAHREGIFVLRKVGAEPPTRIRFTWNALTRAEGVASRFVLLPQDVVVVE